MIKAILSISLQCLFLFSFSQDYFQQQVNYKINVSLNDTTHELAADETIEYINNSPDNLEFLWFHLWPNAYRSDSTALAKQIMESGDLSFYFSDKNDRGYIDGLDFKINGIKANWEFHPEHPDICKIHLNQTLIPGEKITITTPFHVKLPKGIFSRLGHMGQSYQITQWYPKPAVYDKNGWHPMPYLNQGEFYSEFGNFDVAITLPENYRVGATGNLQNEKELKWLNDLVEKTVDIETFPDDDAFPPSSTTYKTIRYTATNVHDFAWFADKRYHVLKGEVELPHSKKKVTIWSMFTNGEANLWENSIEYINNAIYYYSLWVGDYPYEQMTAVDGALSAGAGMEYPNVTVIGKSGNALSLETVIVHEVGHNWFYGILASNERQHPWMDEGMNSYYENRYLETLHPDAGLFMGASNKKLLKTFDMAQYGHKTMFELGYLINARRNMDQPIELPADKYTMLNYGGIVYGKTALVFDYLMAYLGNATFDQLMQDYFQKWKFKHPQPADFKFIAQKVSGKDLEWFFQDIINTRKKIDYKISGIRKTESEYLLTLKNVGEIASPVSIGAIIHNDSITETKWMEGFEGKKTVVFGKNNDIRKFRIDPGNYMPEINSKNNIIKTRGLLKKAEPLRLQFLGSIENPKKTQLFYTPVLGWNNYDKLMAGMALYNKTLPSKKVEYVAVPMYSFGVNSPVGTGKISLKFYPNKYFRNITLGLGGSHFHFMHNSNVTATFTRFTPEIQFDVQKKEAKSDNNSRFFLRSHNVTERYDAHKDFFPDTLIRNMYNEIQYAFRKKRTLNPFGFNITMQQHEDFVKTALEGNYFFTYNQKQKGLNIRLFAGKFIVNNSNNARYNWRMDGQSGFYNYTYDHIFLDRSREDDVLGNQFIANHGAFKVPTPIGQSDDWIAAINLKSDIPGKLPLGIFSDFGFNANNDFLYDAGIYLKIMRGVFEIYVPVFYSDNIKHTLDVNNIKFAETIRFTLNVHRLNPFNIIDNFEL